MAESRAKGAVSMCGMEGVVAGCLVHTFRDELERFFMRKPRFHVTIGPFLARETTSFWWRLNELGGGMGDCGTVSWQVFSLFRNNFVLHTLHPAIGVVGVKKQHPSKK